MTSLFEKTTAQQIIERIEQLTPDTPAQWGKMNVMQMLAHCSGVIELYFSGKVVKQPLIGVLFGGIAKRKMLSSKPWAKNLPTLRELVRSNASDFQKEKTRLINWVIRFADEGAHVPAIPHPFFGKMTTTDWGLHQYKHLNHHLTQFGV